MANVVVRGRSQAKALELLAAAEEAGIDPRLVRTTSTGYLVPEELVSQEADEADAPYDPNDHTVAEVNDHLASVDDQEEYDRILAAEEAGQARKGVLKKEDD